MLDFSNLTEQDFLDRKIKNLQFFRTRYKGIYDHFHEFQLSRLELSITPGSKDVQILEEGEPLYPTGVAATSAIEARDFVRMFSAKKRIKNFGLKIANKLPGKRFALDLIHKCGQESPVSKRHFEGYVFDGFVPSVVFLGVGLGLHIDEITKNTDIVNAIIYEPDPEFFALSMFVVDWQEIWERFEKQGYSLTFVISSNNNSSEHVRILENEMKKSLPLHPDFTVFLSHRNNISNIETFKGVRDRLPTINANADNFDRQIDHLNQELHNLQKGSPVLRPLRNHFIDKPIVIVGSGPSLDHRVESLKSQRNNIVLMSAGTGLRVLLRNGLEPDFHVELDSDFIIYEILSNSGLRSDNNVTLFAKSTVNPRVTELFPRSFLFFNADTNNVRFWGFDGAISGASPTCTNAAASLAVNLGFRSIFFAGSDYGFFSDQKDHSEDSVYGDPGNSEFIKRFQVAAGRRHELLEVESVWGGKICTRQDYLFAKIRVEDLIRAYRKSDNPPHFYSISDGARIEGTDWVAEAEFPFLVQKINRDQDKLADLQVAIGEGCGAVSLELLKARPAQLQTELERRCTRFVSLIEKASLTHRVDCVRLANEMRLELRYTPSDEGISGQVGVHSMAFQLIWGSTLQFIYLLLAHGLACEDGELDAFFDIWRKYTLQFFYGVPCEYKEKILERPLSGEDCRLFRSFHYEGR